MTTTHGAPAEKTVQSQKSDAEDPTMILEQAQKAVSQIKKQDITELKSLGKPPVLVKLVLESICVLMGVPLEKRGTNDYWISCQRLLGEANFLKKLLNFDKDHIPTEIMHKLRTEYINRPDFNRASVARVSAACAGLCSFVLGIEQYDRCRQRQA